MYRLQPLLSESCRSTESGPFVSRTDFGPQHFDDLLPLVGRKEEQKILQEAYDEMSGNSGSGVVLVKGYSGTGKTTLVQTAQKKFCQQNNSICCNGKFDQIIRNTPYSALIDAFSELIEQILRSPNLEEIRNAIQESIGETADTSSLTNFLPNASDLIGEFSATHQKPEQPQEAGNFEVLNRFRFIVRQFLKGICSSQFSHRVVIFIDDLQWADRQSLDLIHSLLTDPEISNFLFIGSYRENEVLPDHPLTFSIKDIEESRELVSGMSAIKRIHVENMTSLEVNEVLSNVLDIPQYDSHTTKPLASLVREKTGGNIFYVLQFLEMLRHNKEFLAYDRYHEKWNWNLEKIRLNTKISDNLADLVVQRLKRLDEQTQESLRVAACLGFRFSANTLDHVLTKMDFKKNSRDTLRIAKKAQLITSAGKEGLYRFLHDRIHKGAYSLTPEGIEREMLHKKIGIIIWKQMQSKPFKRESDVFMISYQLKKSLAQIHDDDKDITKIDVAKINLQAAEVAISKSSYFPAKELLTSGVKLLPSGICWRDEYELTLKLIERLAQVECIVGDFESSRKHIENVLANAKTEDEKFPLYQTLSDCLAGMGDTKQQLEVGKRILRTKLGLKNFPKRASLAKCMFFWATKIRSKVQKMTDEDLMNLPRIEDKQKLTALSLLCALAMSAYFVNDTYLSLSLRLHSLYITVNHGISDHAGEAFALYSTFLAEVGDIDGAYRFAVLSEKIQAKLDNPIGVARSFTIHAFAMHWRRPIHDSIEPLLKCYRIGLEVGDIEYAMHSISQYFQVYMHCGYELGPMERDLRAYISQMDAYKQQGPLEFCLVLFQFVYKLRVSSDNFGRLSDAVTDIKDKLRLSTVNNDKQEFLVKFELMYKLQLCVYFGDLDKAYKILLDMYKLKFTKAAFTRQTIRQMETIVYIHKARNTRKNKYKSKANKTIRMMQGWVSKGAVNCTHKLLVLEAEFASLSKNDPSEVRKGYDKAIVACRRMGFKHDEALACERAGVYFQEVVKDTDYAGDYFARAYKCYHSWGASAKCVKLLDSYHFIRGRIRNVSWIGTRIKAVEKYSSRYSDQHMDASFLPDHCYTENGNFSNKDSRPTVR